MVKSNFVPDSDKIFDAILSSSDGVGLEREQGGELVEAWIGRFAPVDLNFKVRAVELGFIFYVDSLTAVIGVQDAIMEDDEGLFGNEWKSAKEPKRYNGKDSWWWNEDVWLNDISNGAQVQIYALALNRGIFYESDANGVPVQFNVENPRIRVRAAVKAAPVRFWPSATSGVYRFTNSALDRVEDGLRSKAAAIRAARSVGHVPWQLTGRHCFEFGNTCQFFEQCRNHHHPVSGLSGNDKLLVKRDTLLQIEGAGIGGASGLGGGALFDSSDPAARLALPFIPSKLLENPEFVVLSASQYSLHSGCAEKYRIINTHVAPKGSIGAQDAGSAMHAGLAEFYRQIRNFQKGKK